MKIFNIKSIQFVWILIAFNAFFIFCYFSGISFLQQFVAPTINKVNFNYAQMREFGSLEMMQNILLLSICFLLLCECFSRQNIIEKIFYFIGAALFVFLFLEELDYGLHIYKYLSGDLKEIHYFSWHNQWEEGVEKATKLKRLADAVTLFWFVLIPLLLLLPMLKKFKTQLNIIPSCWFILSIILAVLLSKVAHYLDDNGFGIINGVQGNLHKTIAEFRETSMYYLYFLYAVQLVKTKNPITLFNQAS